MNSRKILSVLAATIVILAAASTAAAHEVNVTALSSCDDTIALSISTWDGIIDDVYQGDDARTVDVQILIDGDPYGIVHVGAPAFAVETSVTVEGPGPHTVTVQPASPWASGESADAPDGNTIIVTIESGCLVPTTTTTTTTTAPSPASTTTTTTTTVPTEVEGEVEIAAPAEPAPATPTFTG